MPDQASDNATLKDALTTAPTTTTTPADDKPANATTTAATTTAATTGQDPAEQQAAEMGRIMLQSGVTMEQINDLLQAPQTLAAMRHLVRENPVEFLNMLDRTDPGTATRFHEAMANEYIKRHDQPGDQGNGNGNGNGGDKSLMQEVQLLREKVTQAETREQQREQAAFTARVQSQYNSRVDELMNQDGVKELKLTPAQNRALRADLNQALAADPNAVKRISNGNFYDVPRVFKTLIEGWAGDNKKAADDLEAQRKRSSNFALPEFASGPESFMPPAGAADSWEATEEAFAAALSRTGR